MSETKTKFIMVTLAIAILALGGFLYSKFYLRSASKTSTYQLLSGTVKQVNRNHLIIEGTITSSDRKKTETKTFDVNVDSDTKLTNRVLAISPDKIKPLAPGQTVQTGTVTAKILQQAGSLSDLKVDSPIIQVTTKEDLFLTTNVTATYIYYETHDVPKPKAQ